MRAKNYFEGVEAKVRGGEIISQQCPLYIHTYIHDFNTAARSEKEAITTSFRRRSGYNVCWLELAVKQCDTMPSKVCTFAGCDKRPVRASRCKEHQKERVCRPEHRWEQCTFARLNQLQTYSTHSTCNSCSIYVRCVNEATQARQ